MIVVTALFVLAASLACAFSLLAPTSAGLGVNPCLPYRHDHGH